jgi:hypothetical protein
MYGLVKGVLLCQQNRTQDLNERIYSRNIPSNAVQMQYGPRAVSTKFVRLPVFDKHQESETRCHEQSIYNTETMFTPGNSLPFNGYQSNVDIETKLRNAIFPLQGCPQARYIPSSNSDMFNSQYLSQGNKIVPMTNPLLFKEEQFNKFDPNTCDLGYKLFNNHTRVQIRNL